MTTYIRLKTHSTSNLNCKGKIPNIPLKFIATVDAVTDLEYLFHLLFLFPTHGPIFGQTKRYILASIEIRLIHKLSIIKSSN